MTWSAFLTAIRSGAQSRVAPNMRRAATSQARAPVPQFATKDGVGLHQEAAKVVEASPLPTRPDEWDINVLALDEYGEPWCLAPTW